MRELEPISLEECKEIELDMFRQIVKVCEKHKLRYILDYGTLIGAVRHGGFIPWDDDIDISMPRPDYNVFKQVFDRETENSRYELRTGMKGNVAIPYIQVVHRDTITQKKGRREMHLPRRSGWTFFRWMERGTAKSSGEKYMLSTGIRSKSPGRYLDDINPF